MELWEQAITDTADVEWKARKFIKNLKEHKSKYPTFDVERMALYFCQHPELQGRLCYQSVASISKTLRKDRAIERYSAIDSH